MTASPPSLAAAPPALPFPAGPPPAAPLVPRQTRRRLASLRTVAALVLREMATTYGRSPGGYLWAVIEPVAGIALLTIIFSVAFRAPPLGISFPLFYATGMIPFTMFMDVSNKLAQSITFSRQLLAYPTVTFLDALAGRFVLNALTELMVAYLILAGILAIFETRTILDLPTVALALTLSLGLALGVGTLNCFLSTRYPLWARIWAIAMRPLFIVSCIFLVFDSIPEPWRGWLWWNPLVHLVGLMRRGFYPSYDAPYVSVTYVLAVSGITLLVGLILLKRHHRYLVHET
jgi:capsular polysaccharide transport system permease protein